VTVRPQRVIVIDEDLDPDFARQLMLRGRTATCVRDEKLRGQSDKRVLEALVAKYSNFILVTANRDMPREWPDEMKRLKPTIAVITSGQEQGMRQQQFRCDLIHRWAHSFKAQTAGSLRVYNARGGAPWTWLSRGKVPKSFGYRVPGMR